MNTRLMVRTGLMLVGVAGAAIVMFGGTVTLSNKTVDGDGRYWAAVDDYGGVDGWTSNGADALNPAGAVPARAVMFVSALYLFVTNTQRELLSDSTGWQNQDWNFAGFPAAAFSTDTSLYRNVTSANVGSDTNGDGFLDTAVSAFTVTGTGVNLSFTLRQSVLDGPSPTTAVHTLTYTIVNNGDTALSFKLVRHTDGDLLLTDGSTSTDPFNDSIVVGGEDPANGLAYVGQNEGGDVTKGYTLWSPQAHLYNATICGQNDASGTPYTPQGFTGPMAWTNFGLPSGWTNHGANIGLNTAGTAAASGKDTGTYMQWNVTLNAGQNTTISLLYTFGGIPLIRRPGTLICIGSQS